MDKSSREYEVCLCRHVKRGQIEDFIKETGTTELKAVCTAMNIGNVCERGLPRDHRRDNTGIQKRMKMGLSHS